MNSLLAIPKSIGINLIGYASANLGLGHTLREFARALMCSGYPVAILDVDAGLGRSGFDLSLQSRFVSSSTDLPHEINVWMFGAPSLGHLARQIANEPHLRGRLNAAFVWWELTEIPPRWAAGAQAFDALIAGSEFVRETLSVSVPNVPTLLAKHPLELSATVTPDRPRFGLPADALLVYTGFEPNSDPQRKNPFAALMAFQRAFPTDSSARLVIKLNNPDSSGKIHALLQRLYSLIAGDDRVLLIQEQLPYTELLSLYASCDIFLSLHRSEGLGLVPLEAMRLGKPVVATGWSGNMSYMNHCNAGLVRYSMVETTAESASYSPSATGIASRWAEPDIDHAAAWLRAFSSDPSLRAQYGQAAAESSRRYDAEARELVFARELEALNRHRMMVGVKDYRQIVTNVDALERDYGSRLDGSARGFVARSLSALRQRVRL